MVYVRPSQLAKLLHLSRTTIWRLLNAFAAEEGNEHAVIEISKTLKLVPLYRFQEWLTKQDKSICKMKILWRVCRLDRGKRKPQLTTFLFDYIRIEATWQ